MSDTDKHPSNVLIEDMNKFVQDITSLYTTLPLIMYITGTMKNENRGKYETLLKEKSESVNNNGDNTTYTISHENANEITKARRQFENFKNLHRLIPRHFVISLVSQYDFFLGRILRFLFSIKPEMLNASDKSFTYTDLIRFSDIDSAREFIIEKEIETVIRKSHSDQFSWLKERLKTPFNENLESWPLFIELTERRNLFVHTDGKISSQYIHVCNRYNCELSDKLSVGDELGVSKEYFDNSYQCVLEIGVKLAHVIWRRLCPNELEKSDENITDITFELIEDNQFNLAIRILDFFTQKSINHSNDINRRVMIINLAQAHKWNNDMDKCERILSNEDWTACDDRFKIAVAALNDDFEECYRYMRRLQNDEEFSPSHYKDWPLFRLLREQPEFPQVYEECYKVKFLEEQSEDILEDTDSNKQPF